MSARESRRSNGSPSTSITPPLALALVAWRTDHEQNLGRLGTRIAHAMSRRAPVVDAVAGREVEQLAAELQVDAAREDEQQLLGVAVRVWLVPRRAARIERGGHHLERMKGLRREQCLAAEVPPLELLPLLATQDPWPGLRLGREQV